MAQKDDFFFEANSVEGITEVDYQRAMPYVETAQAFAQTTYQSIYIIDYHRKNFLYVSDNPLFLCGHTSEEVRKMGYDFYLSYVPKEEVPMLTELNRSGFRAFYDEPVENRRQCMMSYDFHIAHGNAVENRRQCMMSYDFHIAQSNRLLLINHKITPLAMTTNGRVWLALCTVSLSSQKEAGHIEFRQLGTPGKRIYSLTTHRWQQAEDIALRPEEKQVLILAAQGYTIQDIADRLCRGTDTVKHYRRQIFQKLDAQSITEALAYATNYGLL